MTLKPYPKYKPSGVEWLGDVPEHWVIMKIKHFATYKSGDFIQGDLIKSEGLFPVYGGNGLRGYYDEFMFDGDYILIGRQGALCGNINYASGKFWPTEHAIVVHLKVKYHLKYVGELLRTMNLGQYSVSAAQPGIGVENISNIYSIRPPLSEQTTIANFLDRETARIDTLIAKQQRMIELLKEKRQAVISHAVTKGLDPTVKMKESGVEWLGEVPEHWDVKKLGTLTDKIGSGKTPKGGSEVYTNQGVIFIRSQNVYDEGLRLDDVVFISENIDDDMENTRVLSGDILLNVTGASIGRTTLVPDNFTKANVNQHVCIIRISNPEFRRFISLVMKSGFIKNQINMAQNGAAREGLNFEQIANLILAFPPLSEQLEIAKYLDSQTTKFDTLIQKANQAIELLKERRTALISAAVTGKIDVREAA